MSTHLEVLRQRDEARARVAELEAENIRLKEEVEALKGGAVATVMRNSTVRVLSGERDRLLAENTPLRERLALVEPVLTFARDFERALLGDEDGEVRNWLAECGAGSLLDEWHAAREAIHSLDSAVTGTTSDSAPVRQPTPVEVEAAARALWTIGNARIGFREWEQVGSHYLVEAEAALRATFGVPAGGPEQDRGAATLRPAPIAHAFLPAPFYPERCDARVEDDGKRRQCGQPRSEHQP